MSCALAVLSGGCAKSTAPDGAPDEKAIFFTPAVPTIAIDLDETAEFSVSAPDADVLLVNWWRNGLVDRRGATYTYEPRALGVDSLRAQVDADGTTASRRWLITVSSTVTTLPAPVPTITAEPGPAPGDVNLSWIRSGSSTYPVVSYLVAARFDEPVSEQNWDTSLQLREVTNVDGRVGYSVILTVADDQMVPGAEVWFGVRARDELGQLSPMTTNGHTTITTAWWANGTVVDDLNQPVPSVSIRSDREGVSTNSDESGSFRIGPFRSIDAVVLTTISGNEPISGWFDFQTPPLDSISGHDYRIVLITRHQMDPACADYNGQFLTYLRFMSKTRFDINDPRNPELRKWSDYPLRADVPDLVNNLGVDFGEASRFAMAFWDSVMGESYFTEVAGGAESELVFTFDGSRPSFNGQIRLLQPSGPDDVLGKVIPQQIEVYLNTDINTQQLAREVALHELGHALGLLAHTGCSSSGYLMVAGGGTGSLTRPNPIHPDEQNAVRCIRQLPQGVDMAKYSLN